MASSRLSAEQRAVMDLVHELHANWRKQGYRPMVAPHHIKPIVPNERAARRVLNDLVELGELRPARHGRYRVWVLANAVDA